jgi:hypothetical protein
MGDDSKEAKDRVKEAQAAMREFIGRTGRTRRYDRESLYSTPKAAEKTEKPEKVNSQLTPPVMRPVNLGSELTKSLGTDAQEYTDLVTKAGATVANLYTIYGGDLTRVTRLNGGGEYSAAKTIEWDYATKPGKHKYSTLAHEYGHHTDAMIPQGKYSTKEVDYINQAAVANLAYKQLIIIQAKASCSDEFLTAMRADREKLKGFLTDADENKRIKEDLMHPDRRNMTSGIQDAFDGFWGTQDKSPWDKTYLPWGHGNKYYNRKWNGRVVGFGVEKEVKQAFVDLGFDASNQTKAKKIMRDYETASELWANVQSAMTVGGDTLTYMRKYFPESCAAWEKIAGSV